MTGDIGKIPSEVKIFTVRQYSISEMQERTDKLLKQFSQNEQFYFERGDKVQEKERTLIRLPKGGRAIFYHASGSIKVVAGLNPMENLFDNKTEKPALEKLINTIAKRMEINQWAGEMGSLDFERLWQIKAAAADKKGKLISPVLCRIVGAYRHKVNGLPVLGAASMALKLAGNNQLDSIEMNVREIAGKAIDSATVISSEEVSRRIWQQLISLHGNAKEMKNQKISSTMQFGYLALGKRKQQRVLAPHFIATINIENKEEAQGYQFVVPATEKTYLPICMSGSHPSNNFEHRPSKGTKK